MFRQKDKKDLQLNKVFSRWNIQFTVLAVVFFLELTRSSALLELKNMFDHMSIKLPDLPTMMQSSLSFASLLDISQIINAIVVVCTIVFVVVSLPLVVYFSSSDIDDENTFNRKFRDNRKACSAVNRIDTYKIQSKYLC